MAENPPKLSVIAFGGNAVDPTGNSTAEQMWEQVRHACGCIVPLFREGYRLVLTHGNGPQVGRILLRMERTRDILPPMPMDICVADTQAAIGYMIQQSLQNEANEVGMPCSVATVVTQVEVDERDPAFENPTKPIGSFYSQEEARRAEKEMGWRIVPDSNRGYRRVVPSPKPIKIVELPAIEKLVEAGLVVITVGGGGIPVVRKGDSYVGVEAVIDKDYASALLANDLKAHTFIILTGVDQVSLDYGKPTQRPLPQLTMAEARTYLAKGQFPEGSMGPKIEAALQYLERGGREVLITSMESLRGALQGETGTRILRD
ncbi:MAG: carbamate kinase [Nitrospinota bacterium]